MPKTYISKLNPHFYRKGKKTNAYYFSIDKRYCSKCKTVKSLSELYKSKANTQGRVSHCKSCMLANYNPSTVRQTRQKNEWKGYEPQPKKIYQSLKNMTLGTSTRGQKGHSQHKLLITKDEFIKWYNNQTKTCAYCGLSIEEYLKINKHLNRYMQKAKRLGVDRKDNTLPYSENNIALCCPNCNRLKGYFFDGEEFEQIVKEYVKPKLIKYLSYE